VLRLCERSQIYLDLEEYEAAEQDFKLAAHIADSFDIPLLMFNVNKLFYKLYSKNWQYQEALQHYKRYKALDSVINRNDLNVLLNENELEKLESKQRICEI
jgi:tetratricopeptide (TPR) repeat protein